MTSLTLFDKTDKTGSKSSFDSSFLRDTINGGLNYFISLPAWLLRSINYRIMAWIGLPFAYLNAQLVAQYNTMMLSKGIIMGFLGSFAVYDAYRGKGKDSFSKGVAVLGLGADVLQILSITVGVSGVLNVTAMVTWSVSVGSKTVTVVSWVADFGDLMKDLIKVMIKYFETKTNPREFETLRGGAMVPLERVDPTTLREADLLLMLENPLFLEQLEVLALAADPSFQRIRLEILKRRKTNRFRLKDRLKGKGRNLKEKIKTKASNGLGTIVLGLVLLTSSVDTQPPRNTESRFSAEPVERILTRDKTRLTIEKNQLKETQSEKNKKTAAIRSEFREAATKRAAARKAAERRRVRTLRDLPPLEIVEEEVEELGSTLKTKNRIRIRIREN